MTEPSTPTTTYSVWNPTDGYPFWLAECTRCGDNYVVKFAPVLGVTYSRGETMASDWARTHSCHPSGRSIRQQLIRDDYLNDRWAGDVA